MKKKALLLPVVFGFAFSLAALAEEPLSVSPYDEGQSIILTEQLPVYADGAAMLNEVVNDVIPSGEKISLSVFTFGRYNIDYTIGGDFHNGYIFPDDLKGYFEAPDTRTDFSTIETQDVTLSGDTVLHLPTVWMETADSTADLKNYSIGDEQLFIYAQDIIEGSEAFSLGMAASTYDTDEYNHTSDTEFEIKGHKGKNDIFVNKSNYVFYDVTSIDVGHQVSTFVYVHGLLASEGAVPLNAAIQNIDFAD